MPTTAGVRDGRSGPIAGRVPARAGWFAWLAWGILAYNLAVISWGAYVRATGSGAGCGDHWPLCNGEVVPRSAQTATVIEFTHRVMSGLALVSVAVLAIGAFRIFPRGHQVRYGAVLSVVFMLTEALIGAGLVLFRQVAQNASLTRAFSLSIHLINTFVLLAALAATAWWGSGGPAVRRRRPGSLVLPFLAIAAALVLGVSGAIAALGDTLFPPASLAEGLRQDFSPAANLFVRLRVLHPMIALAAGALVVLAAFSALASRNRSGAKGWAGGLLFLVPVQLGAGFLNVLLRAPVWMQLVHLFLADLIWIALVLLTAALMAETDAATG